MVELLLLYGLTVHKRAIRAAQIDDPELIAAALEPGVVAAGCRVAQDHVVVRRAAQADRMVAGPMRVTCVRT